jgi:predicted nucleotidyltransferase
MQKVSFPMLKKKLKRYPHLNELKTFMNRIEKDNNLKLVLLYGSLAKGSYTQHSDIDVLCVFDKKFNNTEERFLASYKYSDGLVQPKNLSYQEFKHSLRKGNSFLYSICKDGFILYSKIPMETLDKWLKEGKNNLETKAFLGP